MTIYCTYCGQGFARSEHLQRHVLTHSDLRPFDCPVCHLTFKRKDLMKKHFLSHHANDPITKNITSTSAQDSEAARALLAKVRSSAACSNCARTKTKCDNDTKRPCTRCQSKGLACAARTSRPRGPRPKQKEMQGQPDVQPEISHSHSAANSPVNTRSDCCEDKDTTSSVEFSATGYAEPESGPGPGPSSNAASSSLWNTQGSAADYPPPPQAPTAFLAPSQQEHTDPPPPASVLLSQDGFDPDLFLPMGSIPGAGSSVVFGPSWDFGNSPDELEHFLNPAPGVFSPFLPFASPSQFDMEPPTPVVTNGRNEDAIVREAEPKPQVDASTLEVHICSDPEPVAQTPSRAVDETVDNGLWALPKDIEHWTMLQCCPTPSSVCPGRATAHLSFLEENSCLHRSAGAWSLRPCTDGSAAPACVSNVSLSALTRERLSAITQSFFRKALETHGLGSTSTKASSPHRGASEWFGSSGFILLPPTADLNLFLETYVGCVEPFFPLVPTRTLDPNELLGASDNEKGATLLLLLMMAIGASCNPAPSARRLGAGLAEVCRIALTDLVEKDNQYSTVPLILQCSLLLTIQSCWGGEKWQMDIGAGHRFMYIAMLRNAGYFQNVTPKRLPGRVPVDRHLNIHHAWRNWVEQEGRRRQVTLGASECRLAYDWVMLDQELSLFYDQPPTLAITELRAPLPEIDALWHAGNAAEWGALYDSEKSSRPQYSLRRLFQLCLANDIDPSAYRLTPTRLRLLLYPIQSLVFHHSQLLDAVPDRQIPALSSFKTTTRTSSLLRLEELQSLLQTWWTLAHQQQQQQQQHGALNPTYDPAQTPAPPPSDSDQVLGRANLLLFHLISLQLYTNLKAIESFARGEDLSCSGGGSSSSSSSAIDTASLRTRHRLLAAQCVFAPPEALYHAGQILRLVRTTALARRPPWWAAAVYRAALVLWAYASMQQCLGEEGGAGAGASQPALVAIDALLPGDSALGRFLRQGVGVPVLLNGGAASVRVDREPQRVLGACVAVLGAGEACTWFAMGVRIKLEMLLQAWSGLGHGAV